MSTGGECFSFGWPFSSDTEGPAKEMFQKLHNDEDGFPLSVPHEVSLIRSPSGKWIVVILALMGSPGDDNSVMVLNALLSWFEKCDCPSYDDWDNVPVRGSTIESCLPEYDVIESFKVT
jgi:hypothetical protein